MNGSLFRSKRLIMHIVILIGVIIVVIPFLWTVFTAFKSELEIRSIPPHWFPREITGKHFKYILDKFPMLLFLFNSIFVSATRMISTVLFCSLVGFAFAKLRFPLRNFLFVAILAALMFPFESRIVPLYLFMARLGLTDTRVALIVPGLLGSFQVFLMRQAMIAVPDELIDSAKVDGCSFIRIFWHIALPSCKPALVTTAILTWIWSWQDLLWPLVVIDSTEKKTIELALSTFCNIYFNEYGNVMALTLISIVPALTLFLVLQKHFIRETTLGGIKG